MISAAMGTRRGCSSAVFAIFVVLAISKADSSPAVRRDLQDVNATVTPTHPAGHLLLTEKSEVDGTKIMGLEVAPFLSSETEEARGRKKKIKKKLFYHLWHVFYFYAWIVGILIVKFKAVVLFLFGNLTFFVISLIRTLNREVPMWNSLKKTATPPSVYGPPQYPKYGPPSATYGSPSPTYGSPASNYEQNSYSPVGLYKRQGPEIISGNDGGNTNTHDLVYGSQRE